MEGDDIVARGEVEVEAGEEIGGEPKGIGIEGLIGNEARLIGEQAGGVGKIEVQGAESVF